MEKSNIEKVEKIVAVVWEEGKKLADSEPGIQRRKKDGTFVGDDEAPLERKLKELSMELFPRCRFIGEETSSKSELAEGLVAGRVNTIVDPLDGSLNHLMGYGIFAIAVAVLDEELKPMASVLYYPVLRRWYVAAAEKGELKKYNVLFNAYGRPVLCFDETKARPQPEKLDLKNSYIFVSSDPHKSLDLSRLETKIHAFGTTSFHVAALSDQGPDIAAMLTRYKLYDIVGALIVTESSGFGIYDFKEDRRVSFAELVAMSGKKIANRPILVGEPSVIEVLKDQIALR